MILDSDLAAIYGVSTKALNQAVKRNADRFPEDFVFRLTPEEAADSLRSQYVTSNEKGNRSQSVTGSQKHRDPRYIPYAFTEHGALMTANVLRSPKEPRAAYTEQIIMLDADTKTRIDSARDILVGKVPDPRSKQVVS